MSDEYKDRYIIITLLKTPPRYYRQYKTQSSYSTGVCVCVCVCYIQLAGYTSVYGVPGVCNSCVESNSVLLIVANDDTTSAVLPTRRGAHEKTYGIRNRRRNVYASLEVWMLWLGCLSIATVHGA